MRRRIITMLVVALVVSAMVSVMAAGAAFAACGPGGPVAANDQAQGCFGSGTTQAVPNSDLNADEGLRTAFMHNTNP